MAELKPKSEPSKSDPGKSEEPITTGKVTPDWDAAVNHLNNVTKSVMEYAGKPGYNPYEWIKKHVTPLQQQLTSGTRSEELYNTIMDLRSEEPHANQDKPLSSRDVNPNII